MIFTVRFLWVGVTGYVDVVFVHIFDMFEACVLLIRLGCVLVTHAETPKNMCLSRQTLQAPDED